MNKLDLLPLQEKFLNNLESKGKSFNTLKNYKTDLNIYNKFLVSKGRNLSLNEVTTTQVKEYGKFLEDTYNSPNSIRRRVQALRIFFDFLISEGIHGENPVKKMLVSPKVVDLPKPLPFYSVKDLYKTLKNQVENTEGHEKLLNYRNVILFHLIYGAGLKVSDIERLSETHIVEAKGSLRVLVAPEQRDPYTVSLPESFSEDFKSYQSLLSDRKGANQIEFDHLLFNGNPFKILSGGLSARGIELIFKEMSKSNKVQMTAKSLRQACIFKWIGKDIPDSRIKEWMGVQPQYSLKPYKDLFTQKPQDYSYLEL